MEGVENDAPDVNMDSVEPEQDPAPPLLLAEERPAPNWLAPQTVFENGQVMFQSPTDRSRRAREPVFLLEDGTAAEERKSEGSDGPPSLKRTRVDEDGLLAEAVLAYAASIEDAEDLPTTYAQAMASDVATRWREAMDAELLSHERNGTWTLVPRGTANRQVVLRQEA